MPLRGTDLRPKNVRLTEDGSLVAADGRVIYFSCDRFIDEIVNGNRCFLCGATPTQVDFNDEHVLPDWIIRRFGLVSHTVGLPNDSLFRYTRYKIPCCSACNTLLGTEIERPVSGVLKQGHDGLVAHYENKVDYKVFIWLALLFFKTHFKDKELRFHRDPRESDERISQLYEWSELHHIHTVVRSIYTGAKIDADVLGSLLILPVKREFSNERFDFFDLTYAQTIMVRLDDVAVLAVLNDSGGAVQSMSPLIKRLIAPFNELQVRELAVRLAFGNLHIKERPIYGSRITPDGILQIYAKVPDQLELHELDEPTFGGMLYHALKFAVPQIRTPGLTGEQLVEEIQAGRWTCLDLTD